MLLAIVAPQSHVFLEGGPYIGARRNSPQEPFYWVTNEPFNFTAWMVPPGTTECCVHFWRWENLGWNDNIDCGNLMFSYLVEWDADCNNDGIVDYGQIKRGELPDYNGNNIPDCCEQGSACVVGSYPVQWRVEDGGNGHWYTNTTLPGTGLNWIDARNQLLLLGGDLASLESTQERVFAMRLVNLATQSPWIGLVQDSDACEPGCGWHWVSGASVTDSDWGPGEPNNLGDSYGDEDHVTIMGYGWGSSGKWADWPGSTVLNTNSALTEWSADCNNDGIVDYGQILNGTLADANANGVPDTCESTLLVPSQSPTIQAAIDAVPAGAQRTVQVAAGTYHESFALNGKDVIVRGAANNATIVDGTGLTTSIARFTGGEPATAGVESLVFRNGIVGSRFTPKSTFTIGGALYGVNSAAAIRNCRFEQNTADYGAGAYLLRCTMNVVDSDFAGNTARSEGGGMLVFETTGVVSGCDFTQNLSGIAGPGSGSGFKAIGARAAGETVLLTGCTFAGGISAVSGSAVEYYQNTVSVSGILRLTGCTITGNSSGLGAGGLNVIGGMYSCVLSGGTSICFNTTSNVDGPYLIEGSATVCDCLADLTHDGAVNGGDLGVLLSSWGLTLPSGAGDVNHDGVVNAADLALLLGSWGVCN